MALLQVQHGVGTLYMLSVVLLSAIIIICTEPLSVNAFLSSGQGTKGPDPRIKLIIHPKEHVIIAPRSFVLLHCEANFTDYPDYEYENDDMNAYFPSDGDFMQNDEPISDASQQYVGNNEGTATHLCPQEVQYQWLRNDHPIGDKAQSFIQTFCNGTIKIAHSAVATGIYRCVASTTKPEIGAVISKASHVKVAAIERKFDKLTTKVELGSSVVLNCPIESTPPAHIQWTVNNESNINFDTADRYFQLNNGSLLIVNVKNEDYQSFRCAAKNEFYKVPKKVQHSLEVINSIKPNEATLLPALQNPNIFVANGNSLDLHCAPTSTTTSKGNAIRWTFTPRSQAASTPIELTARNFNELHIANTSVEKNDGIYKCHFGDEYQSFDVTITTPPVITGEFTSKEEVLGYYSTLNCSASGNPKPAIQWFRDGKLIEYDWIVKYKEPKLLIQTFEERHKGIYQCIATNVAGEAQATGLVSLKPKQYADAPTNPKCLPLNATTLKITFDGPNNFRWSAITYYTASKYKPTWSPDIIYDENNRIQNEFIISETKRPPFLPFMLYFRGMEKTSSDTSLSKTKGGIKSWQFDLSRLTDGIKCATQGLPVYGMFSPGGIFIWWPKLDHINVTSFTIQFQSDETTAFSDHIVGTTRAIDEFQTWNDISGDLTNIPATANIYPNSEQGIDDEMTQSIPAEKRTNRKMITELRVNGNVSGVLIPNTHEIVVRVLVPIIDDDGELIQDVRYVEWKKIEDVSGRMAKFQVYNIGINHITFITTDPMLKCVLICYQVNGENICDERLIENFFVEAESLTAYTSYKFLMFECGGSKALYNVFDIQTKHDIPGSVTNHKVYKKDGIVIEWSAPTKPNGILKYYLIEWTIGNQTQSQEITYQSDISKNIFKFPVQESDRFNITIRAVSNFGVGIPIYVDLREVKEIPNEDYAMNASIHRDPRIGISIGVLLSVACVAICVLIIVRHRRCSKSPHHQQINGNGNNSQRSFSQNRSPLNRTAIATDATTIVPPTSTQLPPNCAMDAHEMQTLIVTSTIDNLSAPNGNGATKKVLDNKMNGVIVHSNPIVSNSPNSNVHSDDDDQRDLSRCALISSTPKSKHKPIIVTNDHLKSTSTNFGTHTANPVDLAYQRINCDFQAVAVEPTTNILCNGSLQPMKSTLPPNKSVHSIVFNETEIPPTIKRLADERAKAARRTSNQSNVSIPSIFDDSQQSLLPDSNATESSSASTSSGSVPMDRINNSNRLYERNTFDGGPHAIVENQRYMRSAALV